MKKESAPLSVEQMMLDNPTLSREDAIKIKQKQERPWESYEDAALVSELKNIKEAFQWTWDNLGTPHTSDHFNIPANGVEAVNRLIEALSAQPGEVNEGVEKAAEYGYKISKKETRFGVVDFNNDITIAYVESSPVQISGWQSSQPKEDAGIDEDHFSDWIGKHCDWVVDSETDKYGWETDLPEFKGLYSTEELYDIFCNYRKTLTLDQSQLTGERDELKKRNETMAEGYIEMHKQLDYYKKLAESGNTILQACFDAHCVPMTHELAKPYHEWQELKSNPPK